MNVKQNKPGNTKFDILGYRKRTGFSQVELAKRLHVSPRVVRRWENDGIKPQDRFIRKMEEIEADRLAGLTAEGPFTPPVTLTTAEANAVPDSVDMKGDFVIDIAPSSY